MAHLRLVTSTDRATLSQWFKGARPRTFPAAIAPVLAGSGAAAYAHSFVWWKALLALGVSLALQIGVNYANDYSDGIKGTDDFRVGPLRLVGSGLASPKAVKLAAFGFLGLGGLLGLALAATTTWWLLLVGIAAISAAWTYTGGPSPYGYRALGEVSVFVFFGLVAVLGTTYIQTETFTWLSLAAAFGIGSLACSILVANNLRDIPTDTETGKRTVAVALGDARTRQFLLVLFLVSLGSLAWAGTFTPWALLGLVSLPVAARAYVTVASGATGMALIPVLRDAGLTELLYAVGLTIGLVIGS